MKGNWSMDDFEGVLATYEYDESNFLQVLDESKEYLLELDNEKRLEVVRELAKNPNFNDTDAYYLVMMELQSSCKNTVANTGSVDGDHGERFVRENQISLPSPCNVSNGKRTRGEKIKPVVGTTSEEGGRVENHLNPTKIRFIMKKRSVRGSEGDYEEKARAKKKKKKEKKKKTNVVLSNHPSELPQNFKEYIRNLNGSDAILVIEKQLYYSDVNKDSGRLSMPLNQVMLTDFLSEGEMELLHNYREIKAKILSEPPDQKEFMEHDICLIMWKMDKPPDEKKAKKPNYTCNLRTGWNDVRKKNQLCKNMMVQLWSFHVGEQLWFVLVKV